MGNTNNIPIPCTGSSEKSQLSRAQRKKPKGIQRSGKSSSSDKESFNSLPEKHLSAPECDLKLKMAAGEKDSRKIPFDASHYIDELDKAKIMNEYNMTEAPKDRSNPSSFIEYKSAPRSYHSS